MHAQHPHDPARPRDAERRGGAMPPAFVPQEQAPPPAGYWGDGSPEEEDFSLIVDDDPAPQPPPGGRTMLAVSLAADVAAAMSEPPPPASATAEEPPVLPAPGGSGFARFCLKFLLLVAALAGAAYAGSVFIPQGLAQGQVRTALYPPDDPSGAAPKQDVTAKAPPAAPAAKDSADRTRMQLLQARLKALEEALQETKESADGWKKKADEAGRVALKEEAARQQAERQRDEAARDRDRAEEAARAAERAAADQRARADRTAAALGEADAKVNQVKNLHWDRKGWIRIDNSTDLEAKYEMRMQGWDGAWLDWKLHTVKARSGMHHWYRGALRVEIRFDHTLDDEKVVWRAYVLRLEQAGDDADVEHRAIRVRYFFEQVGRALDLKRTDFSN